MINLWSFPSRDLTSIATSEVKVLQAMDACSFDPKSKSVVNHKTELKETEVHIQKFCNDEVRQKIKV